MSEPVKLGDVIAAIFAKLDTMDSHEVNTMPINKLEAIIQEAACPANCPCKEGN